MRRPFPFAGVFGCLLVIMATAHGGLSAMSAYAEDVRALRYLPIVAQVPAPAQDPVVSGGTATMLVGLATLIFTQLFAYLKQKNDTATASRIASLEAQLAVMNRVMSERSRDERDFLG